MKYYLDEKTRIYLKYHLPALSSVFALQRKKWYGWKTVSWIYPSIMKNDTRKDVEAWLEWDEKKETQKEVGERLMTGFKTKEHGDSQK